MDSDAEGLGRIDDHLGHVDIRPGRGRVARWVIMHLR
jgi:hypothetical protein